MLAPLRALGWEVVGLEPDAAYRTRAREIAHTTGAAVHEGTFNTIDASGDFDLVIGINSAFAQVLSPRARGDALARCYRALRPAGVLVLDLPNMLRILFEYRKPEPRTVTAHGCQVRLERAHTLDYHAATFTTHEEYEVTAPGGGLSRASKDHVYAITAWPELEHLLAQSAFARWDVFDAFTARKPGRADGARQIVVARV